MAAKLGRNVAQKQAKEQAKALEEAIASGAVQVKGSAKKKAALRGEGPDGGVGWLAQDFVDRVGAWEGVVNWYDGAGWGG